MNDTVNVPCDSVEALEQHLVSCGVSFKREGSTFYIKGDSSDDIDAKTVSLSRLKSIPSGVTLNVDGSISIDHLTHIPENVTFNVRRSLYIDMVNSVSDGVTIRAGRWIGLHSLKTLPNSLTLSAGYGIGLGGLESEGQVYNGHQIKLRMLDSTCVRLLKSRTIEGVTLWSAQYFKGHPDSDMRCLVVQQGDKYVHGREAWDIAESMMETCK